MKRPIVLIAVVAVALAGCGSGDHTTTAASHPAPTAPAGGSASYGGGQGTTTPASHPAPAAGRAAAVSTADHGLGRMLVDGQGRTLYLWQADTGMSSTCSGACAQGWPPVTTTGTPKAAGGVQAGLLGTTKRADGTLQVTYGGHPLYRYAGDTAAGQVNGQGSNGFGAPWYVVAGDGSAITRAAS